MVDAVVEDIRQELILARDAVAKDDEYAIRYHLKQAYTYSIDIPGFIDHTADTTDDAPAEVARLRNALDGALVGPRRGHGNFISQALDAVNEFINTDVNNDDE